MVEPLVIAHRGVPGERLEHTRDSFLLAIEQGADVIEPDVVATRDGVLVVRHENEIGHTTDVAQHPRFADRRTVKVIDGVAFAGWFTEDFTLEELRTLRCRERLPQLREHNLRLDGTSGILTLDEIVEIARGADRTVGIYPETKHPSYFASIGLDLDDLLLATLERCGINGAADSDVPVTIQSMETQNLRRLRSLTSATIVQLLDRAGSPWDLHVAGDPRTYADLTTDEALADIATYADGIGPNKSLVIGRDDDHRLTGRTGLVERAHAAGLLVHAWTIRDENNFLPLDHRIGNDRAAHGDAEGECLAFLEAGVDGVFADVTRTAVAARARWSAGRVASPSA